MTQRNQENEIFLIERRWMCDGAHERWIWRLTGASICFDAVATSQTNMFKNVVVLIERGFRAVQGGFFRKGQAVVHKDELQKPHDEFKRMVWRKQAPALREQT